MSATYVYSQLATGNGQLNEYTNEPTNGYINGTGHGNGNGNGNGHGYYIAKGYPVSSASHPIPQFPSHITSSSNSMSPPRYSIVTPHHTTKIDVASSRSALQPSLEAEPDEDEAFLTPELRELMSEEDAQLYASLPPPGAAGRLKPRSRALARFYYYLNRFLDQLPYAMDFIMRGVGPVLVFLAWFLFFFCAYAFFAHIIQVHDWSIYTYPGCVIIPYALFLLFHVYYNHIMAVFVKPGSLPSDWPVPPDIRELIRVESATIVRGEGFSKYCKHCIKPKPPRFHHCHVCRTCVARMDHHWIGGCVGFHNYRYFYNFLFWLEVGCWFLVWCTFPLLVYPTEDQWIRMYQKHHDQFFRMHEGPVFFILVLTSAAGCAVGAMLAFHTYLVLTNQTTIEMYHNGKKKKQATRRGESWYNIYDLGYRKNWLSILGNWHEWVLTGFFPRPFGCGRLEGQGLQYELNPKMSKDYYSPTRGEVVLNV